MRKYLVCEVAGRRIAVAWLSFQPDGAISFGLNDRAYISPRFRDRIGIWNAYNRIRFFYDVPSDPNAREPVQNPHFTYHPDAIFHLKSNDDLIREDKAIFQAITDVPLTLQQDGYMYWIRAVSAPLNKLQTHNARPDGVESESLVLSVPNERASIVIRLDFVRPVAARQVGHKSQWCIPWGKVALNVSLAWTYPQEATLAWYHFC